MLGDDLSLTYDYRRLVSKISVSSHYPLMIVRKLISGPYLAFSISDIDLGQKLQQLLNKKN